MMLVGDQQTRDQPERLHKREAVCQPQPGQHRPHPSSVSLIPKINISDQSREDSPVTQKCELHIPGVSKVFIPTIANHSIEDY